MIKKIFALPVNETNLPDLRRKLDELELIVVDHPLVKASFCITGRTCSRGNLRVKKKFCG